MELDLSQWWMPLIAISILVSYLIYSFIEEYRMPMPVAAAVGGGEEAGGSNAETAAVASPVKTAPAKAKRGFFARYAWIWMSLLIGAAAQGYLDFIQPMMAN